MQVHLLWIGPRVDAINTFIRGSAAVCSPVVETEAIHCLLEPRACHEPDGSVKFHAGKLALASQGIILLDVPGKSQTNLQNLHCYARDFVSAPKDKTSAPHMPNTATCWFLSDTHEMQKQRDSAIETMESATSGLVLPYIDLVIHTSSGDQNDSVQMEYILDNESDSCMQERRHGAIVALRDHLLKSCALDAPAMCATS